MLPELKVAYYNKDYTAIKTALINTIKTTPALKGLWTDFSENDFGMVLLELFCGIADMTSYNLDNQVAETFLDTVRKRRNVARLVQMLGYSLQPKKAGMTQVSLVINQTPLTSNLTIPIGTVFRTSGLGTKTYTSKEIFVIPSTVLEPRNCKFTLKTSDGSSSYITQVSLTGVDIDANTSGGVLYAKIRSTGGKNKIALYKNSARTGTLDNTTTDVDKVAYGEVNNGTYVITMSAVNNSNIAGKIYFGVANLPSTESILEEFWIAGPMCYEGGDITETFVSNGQPNQRFNTTYPIQKIPSSTTKTKLLTVNGQNWSEVEDMFFEQQNYFKVECVEQEYSTVIFGDGESGNIPPTGATILVTYVNGTGAKGHTGAGKIRGVVSTILGIGSNFIQTQQYNIQPTTDAADEESIQNAKNNALNFFKNRSRAVNEVDYENLVVQYVEDSKFNPKLVQAVKDETEPDLINELEIYVLSIDPDTGRYRTVDIDLTENGGLYAYISDIKTIPEGIRKTNGTTGFMNGTMDSTSADFYYTVFKQSGYDREVIREEVRDAIKTFYHALRFQESIDLFTFSKTILTVEGVQSVQIFTNSGRTINAANVDMSGNGNKGKVLVLPTDFYTVGERVFLKIDGDS